MGAQDSTLRKEGEAPQREFGDRQTTKTDGRGPPDGPMKKMGTFACPSGCGYMCTGKPSLTHCCQLCKKSPGEHGPHCLRLEVSMAGPPRGERRGSKGKGKDGKGENDEGKDKGKGKGRFDDGKSEEKGNQRWERDDRDEKGKGKGKGKEKGKDGGNEDSGKDLQVDFVHASKVLIMPIFECGDKMTVGMMLDPKILEGLCCYKGKHLRSIQFICTANILLDRWRGILHVEGTSTEIMHVREQLETLDGCRTAISAACWAELMRTSNVTPSNKAGGRRDVAEQSAIWQVQTETDCHIHVARDCTQVVICGPSDKVREAEGLLRLLEGQCVSKAAGKTDAMTDQQLADFVRRYGVSVRPQTTTTAGEMQYTVLGIDGAVSEAIKGLACDDRDAELTESSPRALEAIKQCFYKLHVDNAAKNRTHAEALRAKRLRKMNRKYEAEMMRPPQNQLEDDKPHLLKGAIMSILPPYRKVVQQNYFDPADGMRDFGFGASMGGMMPVMMPMGGMVGGAPPPPMEGGGPRRNSKGGSRRNSNAEANAVNGDFQ